MSTYIKLYSFKDQGHARSGPTDLAAMNQTAQTMGGRIVSYYVTQGRYDAVAIEEWPDQDAAMAYTLAVAQTDDAHSETLLAFNRHDLQRILAEWPAQ